jgi:hypothetical protein
MSITISSTKTFSGTTGNYSLSQTFTASALSSASETVPASGNATVDIFANNQSSELAFLAVKSSTAGTFELKNSNNITLGNSETLTANVSRVFSGAELTGSSFYNDGDIQSIDFTNSDATEASIIVDILYDSTS